MESRKAPPTRPSTLNFESARKSTTPSPASDTESRKFPEDIEKYNEVTEFVREVDEILDFMKPFPRVTPGKPGVNQEHRDKMDHLENLIRLVEQLKELKEKNNETRRMNEKKRERSKHARFADYFEDLPPSPDPPTKQGPFQRSSRSKSVGSETRRKSLSKPKSKISKWTKVKEAFKWEKASTLDTKAKLGKLERRELFDCLEDKENSPKEPCSRHLLKVPERPPGSSSPADSVLSGQISICSSSIEAASSSCLLTTSGYSGDHSSRTHSHSSVCLGEISHCPRPSSLVEPHSQSLVELSSSSGDEKVDEISTLPANSSRRDMKTRITEESDTRRSKSLDGATILGPSPHLLHVSMEFQDELKLSKHKSPWEKVIDIIQTRKDSLKKKSKKRDESSGFSEYADEASPEENLSDIMTPTIEVTADKNDSTPSELYPRHACSSTYIRPFQPVLTLTRPSTEELPNMFDEEQDDKAAPYSVIAPGVSSKWVRVKKAFLSSTANDDGAAASAPSSPLYLGAFFSEHDFPDEAESSEWQMDKEPKLEFTGSHFQEISRDSSKSASLEQEQSETKTDEMPRRARESHSIPLPSVDELSPEFKKKLDEWKKIKKPPFTPPVAKDDGHFISKIGERWRHGHKSDGSQIKHEHHIQDEFYKKLEEWQMLKSSKRSRSQSEKGKDEREPQTPSPGLSRKNSKKKKIGGKSGSESHGGSLKEKEGRAGRKTQKEKDLMWLEKELQKIEREKLRLEREKEKYMEREARLEQMKRTMGSTTPSQEVLIQTATGFFRFEGISQKFTQKLYEWEKARGIAPEASTFALLEKASVPCRVRDERSGLQRSKSVGSVIDSSSAAALSAAHHPSSLSLNDVDDLEAMGQTSMMSDTSIRMSNVFCEKDEEEDEPEALIVDVEDIVEETAAILEQEPQVQGQVPVYSYAPAEVTHLIDSSASGSDGEREVCFDIKTIKKEAGDCEEHLIDENINLLEKLEENEQICRAIENDLDRIDEKIGKNGGKALHDGETDILKEGANLQHSFMKHSGQREEIVHDLVDKMKCLHDATVSKSPMLSGDVLNVISLSTQLLAVAQKLETVLSESRGDLKRYNRRYCHKRDRARMNRLGKDKVWYSIDEPVNDDDTEDVVSDLSSLVTTKVEELKHGLEQLRLVSEPSTRDKNLEEDKTAFLTSHLTKTSSDVELPGTEGDDTPVKNVVERRKKSGLEKSKAQIICSENAAEVYEKNLRVKENSVEPKSPEVLKRRIKENILQMQRLATKSQPRLRVNAESTAGNINDNFEEKVIQVDNTGKLESGQLKARRITDTSVAYQLGSSSETQRICDLQELSGTTPNFVFVPTTRKIISPIQTDATSSVLSYVIDDIESPTEPNRKNIPEPTKCVDIGTPPIPGSPSSLRKHEAKDTAPSIRMIIAKYNKKINEQQDSGEIAKTAMAWRSPIMDRKIKEQMARFEDDGTSKLKHGGKFERGEVFKSSSAGFLRNMASLPSDSHSENSLNRGILKSSSTGTVKSETSAPPFTSRVPVDEEPNYPLVLRALRIKQAKAEFLAKGPGGQSYTGEYSQSQTPTSTSSGFSWRFDKRESTDEGTKGTNRLSVGSEGSFDGPSFPILIKSASAGMISTRASTENNGSDGLIQKTVSTSEVPSPDSTSKGKKFGFFDIKSKFRKVKLRRGKVKAGAVQTLVRQSLFVNVAEPSSPQAGVSRSCPASPVLERSRSSNDGSKWTLSRTRLFQGKEKKRLPSGNVPIEKR